MIERPQNNEKLASGNVYDLLLILIVVFDPPFHHFDLNAACTIDWYVVVRPFTGSAMVPSTLSVESTFCPASGFSGSILCPRSGNERPAADISTGFSGGPTACDASAAFAMLIAVATTPFTPM